MDGDVDGLSDLDCDCCPSTYTEDTKTLGGSELSTDGPDDGTSFDSSEETFAGAGDAPDEGPADGGRDAFDDFDFLDSLNASAGDGPGDAMKETLDGLTSIPDIAGFPNLRANLIDNFLSFTVVVVCLIRAVYPPASA